MSSFGRGYSDYESKDDRIKKEVLKKYDTKKKFKIVKESTKWEVTEYIIIQPKRRDKTECIAIKLAIKM